LYHIQLGKPNNSSIRKSFPNSGTSYTIHLVRELTNTTTATNYGLEGDIQDEESVPAFPNIKESSNGPFLELIPDRNTNIPKLFLTKTHCGGVSNVKWMHAASSLCVVISHCMRILFISVLLFLHGARIIH
jgi:hypothetical protein